MSVRFLRASPYADDAMNLPVKNVDSSVGFYESVMAFTVSSRCDDPVKKAVLTRDEVQMAIAENGGDPSQEGCFFEVDDVEAAFDELQENGLGAKEANYRIDQYGENSYKVFFVVAPDGLCYCIGQRQ